MGRAVPVKEKVSSVALSESALSPRFHLKMQNRQRVCWSNHLTNGLFLFYS